MKTNVKNGIIFLGQVATENATVRIGEADCLDVKFFTRIDGMYPILGATNENGVVERIIIDVDPIGLGLFDYDSITEIDLDDVIGGTVNGVEIDYVKKMENLKKGYAELFSSL
ncbi:MAG: hypothetical protein ACQEW5_09505 [Bacillota bacterium]